MKKIERTKGQKDKMTNGQKDNGQKDKRIKG